MKRIIGIVLALICTNSFGQLSDAQLSKLKYQVDSAASLLHQKLLNKNVSLVSTNFTVDTFKVERYMQLKIAADTSRAEYVIAINDAEIEYDFLLTNYYKLLLSMHDEEGKKSLATAQKKWLKYRDGEIEMTEKFYNEQQHGDPISKDIAKAMEHLELTKERVVELYKHINATASK